MHLILNECFPYALIEEVKSRIKSRTVYCKNKLVLRGFGWSLVEVRTHYKVFSCPILSESFNIREFKEMSCMSIFPRKNYVDCKDLF